MDKYFEQTSCTFKAKIRLFNAYFLARPNYYPITEKFTPDYKNYSYCS